MQEVIIILFVAALGGCVGSFINVVAYRLPEGRSLIWPPSHCPWCKTQLLWWENMPVFGWLHLRGKCRTCKKPISAQYPIVEAICALLFVATYVCYYTAPANVQFGQPFQRGIADTWPIFALHLVLISALLAATVIDARLYIIPLEIPWFVTVLAIIVLPLYAHWHPVEVTQSNAVTPTVIGQNGVHAAIGGSAGLLVAFIFLKIGLLPRSFDDEEMRRLDEEANQAQAARNQSDGSAVTPPGDQPAKPAEASGDAPAGAESVLAAPPAVAETNPVEAFLTYSHPRREVFKELLYVLFPTMGLILAMIYLPPLVPSGEYPEWARVLAGAVCGYLVGGGIIWYTRIFGTLGFGREAMGLGDVHLLGAIGAVLGAGKVVVVFFVAPFLGLLYVFISIGLSRVMKGQTRIIPYGPYLAMAAVLVMLFRQPLVGIFGTLFG